MNKRQMLIELYQTISNEVNKLATELQITDSSLIQYWIDYEFNNNVEFKVPYSYANEDGYGWETKWRESNIYFRLKEGKLITQNYDSDGFISGFHDVTDEELDTIKEYNCEFHDWISFDYMKLNLQFKMSDKLNDLENMFTNVGIAMEAVWELNNSFKTLSINELWKLYNSIDSITESMRTKYLELVANIKPELTNLFNKLIKE